MNTGKRPEQMKIGVFALTAGHHVAAWRQPSTFTCDRIEDFVEIARLSEAAKLDMLFFSDIVSSRVRDLDIASHSANHFASQMFEPLTLLAALAMATTHIGLTSTVSTSFTEPYNLARYFSSLDRISGGRAGWNIVTTAEPEAAENFGVTLPDHDERYVIAREYVEVVKGLWDSWDDNAFVRDRESGLYFDPGRIHFLDHKGEYYESRGPLNLPRCPQGYPVFVQAGSSQAGRDFAAQHAEVVFTAQTELSDRQAFYSDLKQRACGLGRAENEILIMPGICPVVADTEQNARRKLAELNDKIEIGNALGTLNAFMLELDMTQFALDEPLPDIAQTQGNQSRQQLALDMAKRENMTLRELALWFAGTRGHWMPVGTPEQVADQMEACFDLYGCDGFNVMPATFPDTLDDFCRMVVPELQRRGRFRTEYEGRTLRENLGLPYRPSQYSQDRAEGDVALA